MIAYPSPKVRAIVDALELAQRLKPLPHEDRGVAMTMTKPFQLGSISTGTLKPEDLLPAFAAKAESLGWERPRVDRSRSLEEVITRLTRVLEDFCPPFVYFGAHPDDGVDFGFWPDWPALQQAFDAAGYFPDYLDGEYHLLEEDLIVHVEDTNVTVMDLSRRVLWSNA